MTLFDWPMWALAVFAYVIIQRLAELAYANANTRRLLAEGGREHGAKHYPLFILLHSGWLIAIALFAAPSAAPDLLLLNAFIASQTFRFWTSASSYFHFRARRRGLLASHCPNSRPVHPPRDRRRGGRLVPPCQISLALVLR